MTAVWACVRTDLRSRRRAWLGLALIVGLAGAVVLTAAAAARRTDTALPRFMVASRAPDALISPQGNGLGDFDADVAKLPEVADLGEVAGTPLVGIDAQGHVDPQLASPPASVDGRVGYDIYRPNVLSGRMPRPDRETEVLAIGTTAKRLHLKVGSRLTLVELSAEENNTNSFDPRRDHPRHTFTVVGVATMVDDVATRPAASGTHNLLLTPAWFKAHGDPSNLGYSGAFVRLRPGADLARLRQEVDQVASRHPEAGSGVFFSTYADRYRAERRFTRSQAVALGLFAVLAGAAALLIVGQAMTRHLASGAADHPTLRALGMARGQVLAASMIPAAGAASAGAVLAAGLAALASPLGPVGTARLAEPHPGVAVNLGLLGVGASVIAALLAAWVALPAWRTASAAEPASGASSGTATGWAGSVTRAVERSGLPPSAAVGARMALEPGRARTAVPVRSAVVGSVLGLAALVAAFCFVTDLGHLVSTPHLYGTTWDLGLDAQSGFGSFSPDQVGAVLASAPDVAASAGGQYGSLTIGGRAVAAVGLDDLRGHLFPTLLEGRRPAGPDEIVLGTNTLRRAHRSVGQSVDVDAGAGARPMRIVGRAVFPALGRGDFSATDLGEGAATTAAVLASPDAPPGSYNFMLLRLAPGADRHAAIVRLGQTAAGSGCVPGQCPAVTPRPADMQSFASVRWTPVVLAGLLALLAAATIGHALVTSVRRRRRDLAILKTLGFVRRQVSAAVAWQATTLVGLALLVGIPLGLATGRWGWALFARQLGVGSETSFPALAVLVMVPTALVVANLVSALPARSAGLTRPALVLRSE